VAIVINSKERCRGAEIMDCMKFIVALAFLAILGSLASALIFMMRSGPSDQPKSKNMVKALGLRVGISIFLFICVLIAWQLGYIHPTGIEAGR
jgi:hypothetical protein